MITEKLKKKKHIYIITKYIAAHSITEAIKMDKETKPHDAYLDEFSKTDYKEYLIKN